MALPRAHQQAFTPREIEFLAGHEEITVIPTHRMPRLDLIEESYGPFRPPLKAKVPLWLALMMKKNNRCHILAPEWLSTESLSRRLQEEEQESEFSALPFHYMEIAQMLLETAPDDIPDAEEIRRLLKDLRETRQSKARLGLSALDHKWLGVNNLSLMEINEIRPFFTKAFLEMRKLSETAGRP
ncbi:hypothetical protein VTP01DRAFT_1715 [Rhizomucor pusillus]|uniref:uncharacterized protein n=1 Tax=Rhizomucor pusillus TaxID=4840 RepID=UPI00374368AC